MMRCYSLLSPFFLALAVLLSPILPVCLFSFPHVEGLPAHAGSAALLASLWFGGRLGWRVRLVLPLAIGSAALIAWGHAWEMRVVRALVDEKLGLEHARLGDLDALKRDPSLPDPIGDDCRAALAGDPAVAKRLLVLVKEMRPGWVRALSALDKVYDCQIGPMAVDVAEKKEVYLLDGDCVPQALHLALRLNVRRVPEADLYAERRWTARAEYLREVLLDALCLSGIEPRPARAAGR